MLRLRHTRYTLALLFAVLSTALHLPAVVRAADGGHAGTIPRRSSDVVSYEVSSGRIVDGVPDSALDATELPLSVADMASSRPATPSVGAPPNDDRVRVPSTTAYPYSAVCSLRITFPARPDVTYAGTGVLVDTYHVLTVAHNFYASELGGFAARIEVIPGLDGSRRPFGTAWSLLMTTFRGWTDRGKPNWDIGWLTLDRTIGASTGWVCPEYVPRPSLLGAFVEMPGYPLDLEGDVMYSSEGFIERQTVQMLRYPFTTAPGQSGSPLLQAIGGGRYVVVGVHRDQNVRTGQAWGVWIDEEKIGRIRNYIGSCP